MPFLGAIDLLLLLPLIIIIIIIIIIISGRFMATLVNRWDLLLNMLQTGSVPPRHDMSIS